VYVDAHVGVFMCAHVHACMHHDREMRETEST